MENPLVTERKPRQKIFPVNFRNFCRRAILRNALVSNVSRNSGSISTKRSAKWSVYNFVLQIFDWLSVTRLEQSILNWILFHHKKKYDFSFNFVPRKNFSQFSYIRIRGAFRTQSSIKYETFCENRELFLQKSPS